MSGPKQSGGPTANAAIVIDPSPLNPTDATLWEIERNPNLRTTIVAVLCLDRPIDRQRLTNDLEAVSRTVPRLRQRVVALPGGVGTPHWEIDADFDLERHLEFIDTPGGVTDADITWVAEDAASEGFDRDHALWALRYLGGDSGPSAIVLKVHHSLTDGVGGVELLDAILDARSTALPRDLTLIPPPQPGKHAVGRGAAAARALRHGVELPLDLSRHALAVAAHPRETAEEAMDGLRSATRLMAPASTLSPLMSERGPWRQVGMRELDLDRMHAAARRQDCTITHLLFAGVVGGVHAYHLAKDAELDHLRVVMPINFRRPGDPLAGNQWAPVRFTVPADVNEPLERLVAMRELVQRSRREPAIGFSQTLAGVVQRLPSALSSALIGGMMQGVDVVITNVPGFREPRYLCGAAVDRIFAFAPTGGAALNVALLSHGNRACLGVLCDSAPISDPALLGDLIAADLAAVISAAEAAPSVPSADAAETGRAEDPKTTPARAPAPVPPPPTPIPAMRSVRARGPERLSALDTAFLDIETPETPMHLGGVFVLDGKLLRDAGGRVRLDDARRHIEARLPRVPRFTKRLSGVPLRLGRPVWVDDDDFDIARHVRLVSVPVPGGRQDLLDLAATLHEHRLQRRHPLWELWLVDGLADGGVGIVEKIHHSLIDGVSGVELAGAIFDLEPQTRPDLPVRIPRTRAPSAVRRATAAVVEQTLDPFERIGRTARALRSTPRQTLRELRAQAQSLGAAAVDYVRPSSLTTGASFNRPLERQRVLRTVEFSFDTLDRIRGPVGASINDVVLAAVAGGLRRWLIRDSQPMADLHAVVPVSTRNASMDNEPGNRVGAMLLALPVIEPDPLRRLHAVTARMERMKGAHEGEGMGFLLEALDHLPPVGMGVVVRLAALQRVANLVVTNVPGPRQPLYFLGAKVTEMIPIVPLGPGLGLGVAAMSYCDRLVVSLFADPHACPNLERLATDVGEEIDALLDAVSGG